MAHKAASAPPGHPLTGDTLSVRAYPPARDPSIEVDRLPDSKE
jgi:hypothetical protein